MCSLEAERQRLAAERQNFAPLTSRDEIQEIARLAQPPQPLMEHDLQGKSKWELEVMRIEIFARQDRRFRRPALQKYFEGQPGYKGQYLPEEFDKAAASLLSDIQKKNATFIMEYQKRQ